uniref:Exosome complex component RRP45 n=1 Tax=Rhabditophanes sp. KR3021 TaxID=114890 RepID=A0AC35TK85_9BILA
MAAKLDINALSIEQIGRYIQAIEGEVKFFEESLVQLKGVKQKFENSKDTVASVNGDEKKKAHLIPLTETLFVKAKVEDPNSFLIEIGTGYFVEMKKDKAIDFFARKGLFLNERVVEIEKLLMEKKTTQQMLKVNYQAKVSAAAGASAIPAKGMREDPLSNQEKEFILSGIRNNCRLDDRMNYDHREMKVMFGEELGSCLVILGKTKVFAKVSLNWGPIKDNRKSSGYIDMFLSKGNLGNCRAEIGKLEGKHIEMLRCIEQTVRDSDCVDVDSLCIRIGETCMQCRVDIHLIDDCGGLADAGSVAVIGALKHTYLPVYETTPQCDYIYDDSYKYGKPLTIFHTPIATTFGLFNDEEISIVDPTHREEQSLGGAIVISANDRNEICSTFQCNHIDISATHLAKLAEIARIRAKHVSDILTKALKIDAERRKAKQPLSKFNELINLDDENSFEMTPNKISLPFQTKVEDYDSDAENRNDQMACKLTKMSTPGFEFEKRVKPGSIKIVNENVVGHEQPDIPMEESDDEDDEIGDDLFGHAEAIAKLGSK